MTQLKNRDMIQRRLDSRQLGDREIYSSSGYITAILGCIDTVGAISCKLCSMNNV